MGTNNKWSVIIIGHTQMANLVCDGEYSDLESGRNRLLELAEQHKNTGKHKYMGVGRFFNTKTDVCFDISDISSVSITKIEEKGSGTVPLFE